MMYNHLDITKFKKGETEAESNISKLKLFADKLFLKIASEHLSQQFSDTLM